MSGAPHVGDPVPGAAGEALLATRGVTKHYRRHGLEVRALDGVDLTVGRGEILGLVGESGCGKSTLARILVRQIEPSAGQVLFGGADIAHLGRRELRAIRSRLQIVFQDPLSSLDPRLSVLQAVLEPLRIHRRYEKGASEDLVLALLAECGLDAAMAGRYPHQLSGGQRQRVAIARVLVLHPEMLVLDEPVSALDVSVQAQILELLVGLKQTHGLSYVFITHNLAVVRQVSDRIAVMYLGRIAELGTRTELTERALHPYTQALLSSVPIEAPAERGARQRIILSGDPPSPTSVPVGCRFAGRCWKATDLCRESEPELRTRNGSQLVACHYPGLDAPAPSAPVLSSGAGGR